MTYSIKHTSMTLPITSTDRQQAFEFAKQQTLPEKRNQIYQNTLAVLVAHHYLEMLDVPSNLSNSYSWNLIAQFSSNVADLYIPEVRGRLECRTIQTRDSACFIPEEVWENRIGFVMIQFNETYTKGTLLGFVPEVSVEHLPLSYLRSIEDLIDRLSERQVPVLSQWLNNIVDVGWQRLKSLPQLQQILPPVRSSATEPRNSVPELIAILQTPQNDEDRWLTAEALWQIDPDSLVGVKAALDLTDQFSGEPMQLVVAVLPQQEQSFPILVRVYSSETAGSLPDNLRLILLDTASNSLKEVSASENAPWIQIGLKAAIGEEFDIQVCFNDKSYTQSFVV